MKNLIRTILKETIDNRIVDVLIKLKLPNYWEVEEFLKETGYDDNEVKEIYSSYFETISGLKLTPSNWMNYYFSPDQLEIVTSEKYPNSVFFRKNGKVVMEQNKNKKNRYFYFDYNDIWTFFESVFGVEDDHVYNILGSWLKDTLKLEGYTLIPRRLGVHMELEETFKLKKIFILNEKTN